MGSGCGSVGRAVAYDTRDLQFKSRRWQNFIYQLHDRKDENKEKEAGNFFLKKKLSARSKLSQFDFKDFLFFLSAPKPKNKRKFIFYPRSKSFGSFGFCCNSKSFRAIFHFKHAGQKNGTKLFGPIQKQPRGLSSIKILRIKKLTILL